MVDGLGRVLHTGFLFVVVVALSVKERWGRGHVLGLVLVR